MPMDLHSLIARNRPPPLFYPALYLFNLFPLHAPLTLWGMDAPYGRFGQGGEGSWLYMNGNLAWFLMEVTSPITLVVTLWATQRPLSAVAKLCTGLFVLHYTHRSILSPLVYSPRRSLQHVAVPLSAGLFNLLNGYLIACGLAFFPPTHSLSDIRTVIGVAGFLMSFAGNVYHDEVLNDLRRPRDRRLVSSLSPEEEKGDKQAAARNGKEGGRYLIPRAGLFGLIMSPNYFCEILEWTFFALIALPPPSPSLSALPQTFLLPVPALHIVRSQLAASPWALKALSYLPAAAWPNVLIAPPWLFALNAAANMTPRAIRGLAWYRRTFGDRIPEGRKAIVPFLL